jgi:glycosyltransferase involved in cell wall biosynthesis
MKLLFSVGEYYPPQGIGGIQRNTHDLCRLLQAAGHEVVVLAGLTGGDRLFWLNSLRRKLGRRAVVADHGCGYPVYRGWQLVQGFEWLLQVWRPDHVILQSHHMAAYAALARAHGVPAHGYFHSTTSYDLKPEQPPLFDRVYANSDFTAAWIAERYGYRSTVLRPLIEPQAYRVEPEGRHVLFFNPHPDKGGMLAVEIARAMPDLRFDFVSAWNEDEDIAAVRAAARQLPNVEWLPSVEDTRVYLRRARVLLMPSQWIETWGRVASEAQVSGIPVLASDRGGLPEAVGAGGVILAADAPAAQWCESLRLLMADESVHRRLSQAALEHARRPEFQPAAIVDTLLAELAATSAADHRPVPGP